MKSNEASIERKCGALHSADLVTFNFVIFTDLRVEIENLLFRQIRQVARSSRAGSILLPRAAAYGEAIFLIYMFAIRNCISTPQMF